MRKIVVSFTPLITALVFLLLGVSAQAQAPRTFVSAAGTDNSTCSFAAPCRHFQAAVDATSAGGEVDALDPAGYGPITISQAITIEGQGWSYIAPPVGGNGITINAVSGNVAIHGVSINGVGITGGTNGIVFNSGGNLTITNCVVQNFAVNGVPPTGNGILLQPTSGTVNFLIANTTVSNNGWGIHYIPPSGSPTANGVIDHVIAIDASDGGSGIAINNASSGGGTVVVDISNSIASNNGTGIFIGNTLSPLAIQVSIDSVTAGGNDIGISAFGTPNVLLGRSVITKNGTGINNQTSPNTLYSYGDNRINLNGTDISSPVNSSFTTR